MISPKDLLLFTELKGFQSDWKQLGLDVENDLGCLQVQLMIDPMEGSVIQGTGGLRKLRFAPPSWNRGKRGSLRVLYVYYPEFGHILLITTYAKSEDSDFSESGKKRIRQLIAEQRQILDSQYFA